MKSVAVVVEHRMGKIREITFELLNLAKEIAKGNEVIAILLEGEEDFSEEIKNCCDRIIRIKDRSLKDYSPERYSEAIKKALSSSSPFLIILGHTSFGMDLSPFLSSYLSIPLITDCIDIKIEDGRLLVTRQIYGGKVNSELLIKPHERYMITVRPGTFEAVKDLGKSARIIDIPAPEWIEEKRKFLEYVEEKIEDIDISSAELIVSIGRGIGKKENIPIVQEFADQIGAVLCCSRPVADKGWLPKSRQVGTSGKIVKPKLYIALGISGAFQHQVGMKNSKTIIAINKDPKAPIFKIAHYGVVADMFQVLPILKEKLKK